MNAPLRHPQEAASAASREWHAVLRPFLGGWEPVIIDGEPLMYAFPGPANSAAIGYRGTSLFMGRSPVAPTLERIRAAANPERLPAAPVSVDIDAMESDRSSFDVWRAF